MLIDALNLLMMVTFVFAVYLVGVYWFAQMTHPKDCKCGLCRGL